MSNTTGRLSRLRCGVRAGFVVCALFACVGCSGARPPADAYPSASALAEAVLDALQRRDRKALIRLGLSEREFRDQVWPSLPAARPERNLPFTYVWGDLRQKSEHSLRETLARHGGHHYELVGVDFDGATDYGSFRVHRGTTLRVRDESGIARTLRVCGSLLEQDGVWKAFSYVVEE